MCRPTSVLVSSLLCPLAVITKKWVFPRSTWWVFPRSTWWVFPQDHVVGFSHDHVGVLFLFFQEILVNLFLYFSPEACVFLPSSAWQPKMAGNTCKLVNYTCKPIPLLFTSLPYENRQEHGNKVRRQRNRKKDNRFKNNNRGYFI